MLANNPIYLAANGISYFGNTVSDVGDTVVQGLQSFGKGFTNPDREGVAGWFPKESPIVANGDAFGAVFAYVYGKVTGDENMAEAANEGMAANKSNNLDMFFSLGTIGRSGLQVGVPKEGFVPSNNVTQPYTRPSGAGPTAAQKSAVQGQPCVDCGAVTGKQVADHIDPLVVEYYRTGSVNVAKQSSTSAVQPHCPACSASQGGQLSAFAKKMKTLLGF
ncbi:MAG: hypothetical protein V4568_08395 [Pseudomonadota bacterium]